MRLTTGRVASALALGSLFSGTLLSVCLAQTHPDFSEARKAYAGEVRENYNFRFGADQMATPGNAAAEGGDFIQAGAFPKAEYCAKCHQEAYDQWREALHSNSFRTPFYRTSVNILARTKGIEFTRHCDSCHNPIGVLSGGLTQESHVDRGFDSDGLTCMTCHSVQSVQATSGNGGFVMAVPAVMVDENGKRIPGEANPADILKYPARHSKAVMNDVIRQPEFCASCHKANLPPSLNDYQWLRAFSSYDEWQNSKFSQRNPLTFYTADFQSCQNCHMSRGEITHADYGAKNNKLASHRWLAGNTAVPFYYGFDQQLKKTTEFLESGNYLNVDLFAIKKTDDGKLIAPLGSEAFKLAPNDAVQTMVVIQNRNIGHSLVPEVRDLYEAWVEFTVKDDSGADIYRSGFLKPNGMLEDHAHSFTNRLVNTDDGFVDNHKVWTIRSVAYDSTVAAGRSTLVRYEFRIPPGAKGHLTVTARVNYRHLRQSYLNNIFGDDHPAYPLVELSSRTRTLNIGDNAPGAPDPKDNPDWMRWNNLGIAYLDQLQFAESVDAFTHVVKLRPDYADGYTNIGVANIAWEKYASARSSLAGAIALSPQNARAWYYMAQVERRAGNPEAEVAALKLVVSQFPQSRDARRDLGVSYYQQHKYELAVEQFEALQAIDSDDLTAHYNLSILYHRLGMDDKAEREAALYAMKKADPASPANSLEFLRQHADVSTEMESVAWHVHSDRKDLPGAAVSGGGAR